ncbi:MAG: glycerol-3-phosphate dehydrogenase/oxidase [Streptosporangiales bacterium]|nr:glycerol-3-phosphate dehydrogenase/oxidase [Streptosporangiales bacterium]
MAADEFDVVVIGGGVVGAGAAVDAVSRGLTVALVEMRDYAAGTSSRSSKLIHGGIRYLEMLDFALVREALQERGLLVQRLAPHLVHPIPFMYPLKHHAWERAYTGTGMLLYDMMASAGGHGRGMPHHRHLSKRQALRIAPALRDDALVGALQYYDAQVDDARFTMMLARTAAQYGAALATNCRATGFRREGERVTGVEVRDLENDEDFPVRARQIVNATGVWTDDVQQLVGRGRFHVRASKGIHLVVPRDRIHLDTGLILRTEKSVLFVIPWGRHWIVGTTDTSWDLDKVHPAASATDIDYLLEHVNAVLRSPLTRADVEGVYAGLRPLLAGETNETSKLSREHSVAQPVPGLVVVAGGKYTTYRVMAKDAIDVAARGLPGRVPESCTDRTPVVGGSGYPVRWNERFRLATAHGLHVARIEHLLRRYGTLVDELLALVDARPELGKPLPGADDYLAVEAVYAASHEGARHLEDVLTRRTRISIETWDRGVESARQVAELIAPELGWTDRQVEREVEHYRLRIEAERRSQEQLDDTTADAARLGAPDLLAT